MTFQVDQIFLDIPQLIASSIHEIGSNDYFGENALFIPNFYGNYPSSQSYQSPYHFIPLFTKMNYFNRCSS